MPYSHEDLYPFQREAYELAKNRTSFGLFFDMGTGKTPTTISLIRYKWMMNAGVLPTVIFAPQITLDNWKAEFGRWTNLDPDRVGVVKGTAKRRLKVIENPHHLVIIVNYEALRSKAVLDALVKRKFRIAAADESHRIKTYSSVACKGVMKISLTCDVFRICLSGTPITNKLWDIWAQYMFMDRGVTFGNRLRSFKGEFMVNDNAEWQASGNTKAYPAWRPKREMQPEFQRRLAETSRRVTTEEAIDLPELITQRYDLEMIPEQRRHYEEVRQQLITWLEEQEDNPLVVKNALTKMQRLNEICSGYMTLEDGTIHRFKTNPRSDAVPDILEAVGQHKVIIFCEFKQNYADLRAVLDKMGMSYAEIHGGIKTQEKLDNAKLFERPEDGPQVCIANTHSAGIGVNLVGARYKIYYSRRPHLEDYLQSQKRNNREGALQYHDKITDYHLVMPGTVDEHYYGRLLEKKKFTESILDIKKLLS